jgi:putative membrane-bound dehydrogenase-like protein
MSLFKTIAGLLALPAMLVGPLLLGQGYRPEEAPRRMTLAEGFTVKLVAAEPLVRQPVAVEFDDRGRPWVIQYLQYPNPAGLKRVKVDRFSRTIYDRVPEPPPRGPKGADRITILEGMDAQGRAHQSKDFVTGLNLASGLAFGDGGVYVLQAPYLLFYPDRNGDDVPDREPDVLLSGFGMEDASAVANSLTWGPDGWLYGCQGSTVTATIRGIEFQQGIWRYHPRSRRFELFCEGGGNAWGLDFDRDGQLFYSTNVGGYCMVHGVQGGYYWKHFGKHGALHHPHAYGYFEHVPHRHFRGGHVTVGGIIYQGHSFPERFRGRYIAADLLGHAVYWHLLEPFGSSFRSQHGGELLLANDTWFAPTDLTLGPDGSVYVADWYDKRTAHPDPDADWDRTNGRIYKIEARGTLPVPDFDLARLSSAQLVRLLEHPNDWFVRKARRLLAERRDPAVVGPLRRMVQESTDDHLALEALWALVGAGGFNEELAEHTLRHRSAPIRCWAVRLLGDEEHLSPTLGRRLVELAAGEPNVMVRSQLASTARRIPPEFALPIIDHLLRHDEDAADPHLPLLLWWAVERHALAAREAVLRCFASSTTWNRPLAQQAILGRLIRRYAAEGTPQALEACARLLSLAPYREGGRRMLACLEQGFQEHPPFGPLPEVLDRQLRQLRTTTPDDPALIRLLARLNNPVAQQAALALTLDSQTSPEVRATMVRLLGEVRLVSGVPSLLKLLGAGEPKEIELATLEALGHFDDPAISVALLQGYPRFSETLRPRAIDLLVGRRSWARALLQAIDTGKLPATDLTMDQLRPLALYRDAALDVLVRKHWGKIQSGTPEEKLAEIRRFNNDLRAGIGDATRGRVIFHKLCASCHRLGGDGNAIGPDLTHANRQDRDFLLTSLVDPSAVIRKEYLAYVVMTIDGRVLTGLIVEQTPERLTLVDARNERRTISRDQIESMHESPVSLMPEDLLKDLKPAELRDLFRYLQTAAE